MRDEERIEAYYQFGTIDWKSEVEQVAKMKSQTANTTGSPGLRPLLMIWSLLTRKMSFTRKTFL